MTANRAVVALGNPYRRDDGIGPALLTRLQERDLSSVDYLDLGEGGFGLVHVATDYEVVVIVDAVDFGGKPGDIMVFDPADTESVGDREGTHGSDTFELLRLAQRIDGTTLTVRIVGVQPAETGFGESLTPAVAGTLSTATDRLADTVRKC